MTSDDDAQAAKIARQLRQAAPAERPALLDKLCSDDDELRKQVERILKQQDSATSGSSTQGSTVRTAGSAGADDEDIGGKTRLLGNHHFVADSDGPTAADARRVLPAGTVVANRYRIVALLGRGGMGDVYRADDLTERQTVALKFLPASLAQNPKWRARFQREASLGRRITHANICRIHDIGESDGDLFISMEFIDGPTLASVFKQTQRLPLDRALPIARQICAGLAAAHAEGVLHRDLKPSNIMLDDKGNVRITDFGVAGLVDSAQGRDVRAGTPAYMSPEQIKGENVSTRSDLYSLGLVLFQLLTGQPAFHAESVADYGRMHLYERPPAPSSVARNVDPAAAQIILQCLEKNPSDRPESAEAVAAGLSSSG